MAFDPYKIWVGNLPHGVAKRALLDHMVAWGCHGVTDVFISRRQPEAGRELAGSSALVTFQSAGDANDAVRVLDGWPLYDGGPPLVGRMANAKRPRVEAPERPTSSRAAGSGEVPPMCTPPGQTQLPRPPPFPPRPYFPPASGACDPRGSATMGIGLTYVRRPPRPRCVARSAEQAEAHAFLAERSAEAEANEFLAWFQSSALESHRKRHEESHAEAREESHLVAGPHGAHGAPAESHAAAPTDDTWRTLQRLLDLLATSGTPSGAVGQPSSEFAAPPGPEPCSPCSPVTSPPPAEAARPSPPAEAAKAPHFKARPASKQPPPRPHIRLDVDFAAEF